MCTGLHTLPCVFSRVIYALEARKQVGGWSSSCQSIAAAAVSPLIISLRGESGKLELATTKKSNTCFFFKLLGVAHIELVPFRKANVFLEKIAPENGNWTSRKPVGLTRCVLFTKKYLQLLPKCQRRKLFFRFSAFVFPRKHNSHSSRGYT